MRYNLTIHGLKKWRLAIHTGILFFFVIHAPAQESSMYFMHSVPQSNYTNPAIMYSCLTYVELPLISSVKFAIHNSGFGYHDIMYYRQNNGQEEIYLDWDRLDQKLKRMNFARVSMGITLLGFGFRLPDDHYLTFNISNITESRLGYPGDLIALRDGNWVLPENFPRELRLNGFGLNLLFGCKEKSWRDKICPAYW